MKIFDGKSVFDGVAIGKIHILKKEKRKILCTHIEDVEEEIARKNRAVEETEQQLKEFYKKALQEVGEAGAAIFEAHQVMLRDHEFQDMVERLIRTQKVNTEYAVASTSEHFANMFEQMDDDYMKARAADVRDISERLIAVLSEESVDLSGGEEAEIIVAEDLTPSETVQMDKSKVRSTLTEEFAGSRAHNACHTGHALLREDISVTLDVSGGWHQDENGSKDVVRASENVGIMLLAYELFGESFTDTMEVPESGNGIPDLLDEIRYETDWLLKMQDQKTGAIYSGITIYPSAQGKSAAIYVEPASIEAAESFAMCLAKFSYLYQDYDLEYATACLQAADRAWKYAVLNEETDAGQNAWKFAAAAELYRASGKQEYRYYLEMCLAKEGEEEQDDLLYLLGSVTYLMTRQPVNQEYCSERITQLLQEAEVLSAKMKKEPFYVLANEDQTNQMELLKEMILMATVNYIITNHEYETIIENHLHYFMGRNKFSISYIDDVGIRNYKDYNESLGIMNQFDADSRLIFMLGEIISNYE